MQLVFATHNAHKAEEVQAILANTGITVVTLADLGFHTEVPETGDTFVHNALQKAHFVHAATGLPCVADDSGLEVDGLGGAPGVHSKRFSPEATAEANNRLLLERLGPGADRTARFRCVLALVGVGKPRTVSGTCHGRIAEAPSGGGGFGYDPLFLPDETSDRTMAQLSAHEKNAISHRGRAFSQLPGLLA
ncbi:MAG: XTP/dITP diphosphohydrolase [Myxococcota bacterium]|jgi:XTP/dITP diphosphohydrolase